MSLVAPQNESMPFKFNQRKSIQAVAFLLKQKHTRTDNYMRLLKLLYIADRESLEETGRPITGDRFVAMKKGPTLSHLLDLVKQRSYDSSEWDKYIELNGYEITLAQDPGNDKLCRYDVDKLTKIWHKFQDLGDWEVVEETHAFPEWQKNQPEGNGCNDIGLLDVLEALGRKDWYEDILEDARNEACFAHKLSMG